MKSSKSSRKTTFILLGICGVSLAGAFIIGIDDNPPGLLLCLTAAAALILVFVHAWRKAKYFLILSGASLIGFFLFAVLHNLFWALGQKAADIIVLQYLLNFLDVASFLIAILVCPVGLLIGALGSLLMYIRQGKIPA